MSEMSEKLPEPYGWLNYGAPDGIRLQREPIEGIAWLCVSSAPVYSHEQMRVAVAEAAALRRERDEARRDRDMLRLCMNDAACRALVSERDELRTQVHIITSERDELADCVQSLRAKHAEQAEPIGYLSPGQLYLIRDGDGEAGRYMPVRKTPRGLFTLPIYAAAPKRADPKPCRCGPDGCSDSVACPRAGGAA